MSKIKLSELQLDRKIMNEDTLEILTVEDVLNDLEYYKSKKLYTAEPYYASFDADSILDHIIENEADNMYEDWDNSIKVDITTEDVAELQAVLNKILARSPSSNISYSCSLEIEFDA